MGSMTKFDSERRDVVRERRNTRIERKQQRRQARERKRSETAGIPPAPPTTTHPSAAQLLAQQRVHETVEEIVGSTLERHDHTAASAIAAATLAEPEIVNHAPTSAAVGSRERAPHARRRERDIAAFRERRQHAVDEARREARERIARAGEPACVADALAALAHLGARPWDTERRQLERALQSGRILDVGVSARKALWSISRDAARSSQRAKRDPELALAACVAYAIIARVPRTALRSSQRARPAPHARPARQRAFWR